VDWTEAKGSQEVRAPAGVRCVYAHWSWRGKREECYYARKVRVSSTVTFALDGVEARAGGRRASSRWRRC
jgi:hypothetical protein